MKNLENLLIYFSNLSAFYIFSVATSIAVVLLTIYLGIVTRYSTGINDQTDTKSHHQPKVKMEELSRSLQPNQNIASRAI